MKELSYFDFREMLFLCQYSIIPYWIRFYLKDQETINKLIKITEDITGWTPTIAFPSVTKYINGSTVLEFRKLDEVEFCCGQRAGIVIGDATYSEDTFYEILMPMASLEPNRCYTLSSEVVSIWWDYYHDKGMKDIEYWKKVGEENENKESN